MFRRDAILAAALLVAAELELLLRPDDGSELVTALALPVAILPLAWRRRAPLLPLLAFAVVLPLQAAVDGLMIAHLVAPLVALVVALYSAGRHIASARALAVAALAVVAIVGARVGFDPDARHVADAVLTLIATSLPLLVGRWARGQSLLQDEHSERADRLERDRERDTRQAADEERVRIATDLQAAVAGGLGAIERQAGELEGLIRSDPDRARESLTTIAATAREALADVRRVLGILRRDEATAPTTPGASPRAATSAVRGASAPEPAGTPNIKGSDPFRFDVVLVGVLVLGSLVEVGISADAGDRAAALLTGFLIPLPLLARRSHAVLAALATMALIATQSLLTDLDSFPVADIASVTCAAYAIGAYALPRHGLAGLVALIAAVGVHAALFFPDGTVIALFGGVGVPWTIGRIVKAQRRLTDEKRASATLVEQSRKRDAEAAVMAERMRVARELHDAVAHNVSVIAIQAAGADGVLERDPGRAAECATLIEEVAREALSELGRLFDTTTTPQPGLDKVEDLAQRARDGGLPVALAVEGEPRPIPAGVDLAAFRIVQEALANASKHAGDAHTSITVRYTPRELAIHVSDDGRGGTTARARNGTGHGLVGMRERVALYGGTFAAGPRNEGGFQVHATLPDLPMSVRVLIADDQSLVRAGFRLVLSSHDDIEVVGEASNGHEAIHSTGRLEPDVVLMDIRMPELDGIQATREITARHPARVLVLTTYDLDEYVYDALQAGASGFLLKDAPPAQLTDGIRSVAAGEALLAPTVTRRLIEEFSRLGAARRSRPQALDELTPRELDVLELLARGLSNAEIAAELVLSDTTVKTHVTHLLGKLGLRDRVQAVVLAYESGLVTPGGA